MSGSVKNILRFSLNRDLSINNDEGVVPHERRTIKCGAIKKENEREEPKVEATRPTANQLTIDHAPIDSLNSAA